MSARALEPTATSLASIEFPISLWLVLYAERSQEYFSVTQLVRDLLEQAVCFSDSGPPLDQVEAWGSPEAVISTLDRTEIVEQARDARL